MTQTEQMLILEDLMHYLRGRGVNTQLWNRSSVMDRPFLDNDDDFLLWIDEGYIFYGLLHHQIDDAHSVSISDPKYMEKVLAFFVSPD